MSVPSRSRKTAGDCSLVAIEAGDQFVARYGCGPELADNDCTRVVRNLCGLACGSIATQRKREECDRGVAGTGDVEDLPCLRRNVQRVVRFEQHHALLAKCDEEELRAPFLEQDAPDFAQRLVIARRINW